MTIYLVKASILTWYYSITPPTFSRFRLGLHFICGCCIFSFIASLGMLFLYCQPVSRNWSLDERQLCVASAQPPTFFFTFACHILTEILIFVYPVPLLICVRFVPQRQRTWGIIFLFAMGFLAIVATLGKVLAITIQYVSLFSQFFSRSLTDIKWDPRGNWYRGWSRMHHRHDRCLLPTAAHTHTVEQTTEAEAFCPLPFEEIIQSDQSD
jgi:hypothetical protein